MVQHKKVTRPATAGFKPTQFPIGFWNYAPVRQCEPGCVKDWADCGMTLTMSPETRPDAGDHARLRKILDAAAQEGIGVIICHAHSYAPHLKADGETAYRRDFGKLVKEFGGHPAVYGFHVGDEPDTEHFPYYCNAIRIQKEMAPHLSPFCNLLPMFPGIEPRIGFNDWGTYLDTYVAKAHPPLLCYDCYAQMNPDPDADGFWGFEMYFANLRTYWQAAQRHDMDYWTTLLSVGHFRYRCPREDDLRWQVNTAAAHGAKGLLWFFFYMREPHDNYRVAPIDEHWERSETFEWLSRVNRTFLKWHAPVLFECRLNRSSHVGKAWGGWPKFDGEGLVAKATSSSGTDLILSEFTHRNGNTYLAVVNNSQKLSSQAELVIRGDHPLLHRAGWEMKETPLVDSTGQGAERGTDYIRVRWWLAPGQMELFRVEMQGEKR